MKSRRIVGEKVTLTAPRSGWAPTSVPLPTHPSPYYRGGDGPSVDKGKKKYFINNNVLTINDFLKVKLFKLYLLSYNVAKHSKVIIC